VSKQITIDLDATADLVDNDLKNPNLLQGIQLTLQSIRSMAKNNIQYTHFN